MIGRNTLILNDDTVKEALQYYLDDLIFRAGSSQKVVSVNLDRVEGSKKYFKLELEPQEKEDNKDLPAKDDEIPF